MSFASPYTVVRGEIGVFPRKFLQYATRHIQEGNKRPPPYWSQNPRPEKRLQKNIAGAEKPRKTVALGYDLYGLELPQ